MTADRFETARSFPLDYLDRGCLAGMSEEHGCSNAPTWDVAVRGRIAPEDCRRALAGLLERYPTCRSIVRSSGRTRDPSRSLHYVVDEHYALESLFTYVDLRGAEGELEKLRQAVRDRFLDPMRRYPFHLTLARVSDDACRLLFQQHHALADGRAFIELLQDFGYFLNRAVEGLPPEAERLRPRGKRSELEALELSRARAFAWGLSGLAQWLRGLASLVRPVVPSFQNLSSDYSGSNGTVHRKLPRSLLDEWKPLRQRHRISLSAFLSAALFVANRRFNAELGVRSGRTKITLLAETRPRHGGFDSFANHLGGLFAELPMDRELRPLDMMRSLDRQLRREVDRNLYKKRLVFERAMMDLVPLDFMRAVVFAGGRAAVNLNFSNVIAIPFPTLEGPGWTAEDVWITTPTIPPYAVMLTVIDYHGHLYFNFNHKASIVTRAQAERLADLFESALRELSDALAG